MRLEAREVGYRYGKGAWVFRGVSLSLRQGEIIGLMGPSGCGKTTLGRVLSGYEDPVEGMVTLDGMPLKRKGYQPVQMVFQHPEKSFNPRWKLRRSISEGWEPDGRTLQTMGIEFDWLDRWPLELSSGQLQRAAVVRVLGPGTRFLIADELTTMLDPVSQVQIWTSLLEIVRSKPLGMLVISHDRKLLDRLCDRIIEWKQLVPDHL